MPFLHDEGVHLHYHILQRGLNPQKHRVHQAQLVDLPIVKHIRAAHLHISQVLSLLLHTLTQYNIDDLRLSLLLEIVIRISFFFLQVVADFDNILVAIKR